MTVQPVEVGSRLARSTTIDIARDFSESPNVRYRKDGPSSGEEFRELVLKRACEDFDEVRVLLDTPKGFLYSFLEESFGGLVRRFGPTFGNKIVFVASERAYLIPLITDYMDAASKAYLKTGPQKDAFKA